MIPNNKFSGLDSVFWANVRMLSENLGYARRGNVLCHDLEAMLRAYSSLGLNSKNIVCENGGPTRLAIQLSAYFEYRSQVLNNVVKNSLMDKEEAEELFLSLRDKLQPNCPLPLNKQKKEKKNYAFLTCLVNMIVESCVGELSCDYDPRILTSVTHEGTPVRTMSRRVDGAFPSPINPKAIWEIKEYYYTTTFGSRVADGVYETMLDGMELKLLEQAGHYKINHLLIIDSRYTWWECGKSYLCRIIDMLHMGLVDEVIFGREVVTRLPELVAQWIRPGRAWQ